MSYPVCDLTFRTDARKEANALVLSHHYSRRLPSNVQLTGSIHGPDGALLAAAFWTVPPTRWRVPVIELSRLVRGDDPVPLSFLVDKCAKALRKAGHNLLVSFADSSQGHTGYVYRACNWRYNGMRPPTNDGLIINDVFVPGRSCNSAYGTRSERLLKEAHPDWTIKKHFDTGKHLYWLPLTRKGEADAKTAGLVDVGWLSARDLL